MMMILDKDEWKKIDKKKMNKDNNDWIWKLKKKIKIIKHQNDIL